MEDSLELPDDDEPQICHLLSPAPYAQHPESRNTTPPHSLAYSNSTGVKDKRQAQITSPLGFETSPCKMGLIKANNQNYPINEQKTVPVSPNRDQPETVREKVAPRSQCTSLDYKDKKMKPKIKNEQPNILSNSNSLKKDNKNPSSSIDPLRKKNTSNPKSHSPPADHQILMDQRKTIDKSKPKPSQQLVLKKRISELEQALHMETLISEQLRTKLTATSCLLESKLKENGLGYLLSLKNSSRDRKNIDIFIELNSLQKNLTQRNILIDRLKQQIQEQQLQKQKLKVSKRSLTPSPAKPSPNKTILNEQIQKLMEEKQGLINYIQQQKATLSRKIQYIAELEEQVNRISDKQVYYTSVERPKLVQEVTNVKRENRELKEDVERMAMEQNLGGLRFDEEIKNAQERARRSEQTLKQKMEVIAGLEEELKQIQTKAQMREEKQVTSSGVQVVDGEKQVLQKEADILRKERDHYIFQYRKGIEERTELYAVKLKLSMLEQNQLQTNRQ